MTAELLDVYELRQHMNTRTVDEALQRDLNAAEAAVVAKWGPAMAMDLRTFRRMGQRQGRLGLPRPADQVTLVVETGDSGPRFGFDFWAFRRELSANDYELSSDGLTVYRLATGDHKSLWWAPRVEVTWDSRDETDEYIRIIIALCKLDDRYRAASGISSPNESIQFLPDYAKERAAIIASLARSRSML